MPYPNPLQLIPKSQINLEFMPLQKIEYKCQGTKYKGFDIKGYSSTKDLALFNLYEKFNDDFLMMLIEYLGLCFKMNTTKSSNKANILIANDDYFLNKTLNKTCQNEILHKDFSVLYAKTDGSNIELDDIIDTLYFSSVLLAKPTITIIPEAKAGLFLEKLLLKAKQMSVQMSVPRLSNKLYCFIHHNIIKENLVLYSGLQKRNICFIINKEIREENFENGFNLEALNDSGSDGDDYHLINDINAYKVSLPPKSVMKYIAAKNPKSPYAGLKVWKYGFKI